MVHISKFHISKTDNFKYSLEWETGMAFWSKWFKPRQITVDPKKVIAGALVVGTLLVLSVKIGEAISQAVKEHNELQKAPIVRLWSNYDGVHYAVAGADNLLNNKRSVTLNDVTLTLQNIEEYKDYFNPKYFTKHTLDSLKQQGLNWDNRTIAELQSLNKLYQQTCTDLRTLQKEFEKRAEQEQFNTQRQDQQSLRHQ